MVGRTNSIREIGGSSPSTSTMVAIANVQKKIHDGTQSILVIEAGLGGFSHKGRKAFIKNDGKAYDIVVQRVEQHGDKVKEVTEGEKAAVSVESLDKEIEPGDAIINYDESIAESGRVRDACLIELLTSDLHNFRIKGWRALADVAPVPRWAIPHVFQALNDCDGTVREKAASCLATWARADESVASLLLRRVETSHTKTGRLQLIRSAIEANTRHNEILDKIFDSLREKLTSPAPIAKIRQFPTQRLLRIWLKKSKKAFEADPSMRTQAWTKCIMMLHTVTENELALPADEMEIGASINQVLRRLKYAERAELIDKSLPSVDTLHRRRAKLTHKTVFTPQSTSGAEQNTLNCLEDWASMFERPYLRKYTV